MPSPFPALIRYAYSNRLESPVERVIGRLKMQVYCRIDYQIATPGIAAKAKSARVYKDQRFSDDTPLIVDYSYTL